jgi:hypothetical protein
MFNKSKGINMALQLTEEDFKNILSKINISMKEQFNTQYDLMMFECNTCNYNWKGRMIKVRKYKCCPECRRKYVESPYGNNLSVKERHYIKNRARQLLLLKKFNGICCDCKCDLISEPWKAEFHHIDPKTKDFNISTILNSGIKHLEVELDKCVLLCANCHTKRHFDLTKYNLYLDKINEVHEKLNSGDINVGTGRIHE